MSSKGSCNQCCCDPCEVRPRCHECCRCVPDAICVSLSEPAGENCGCDARDAYAPARLVQLPWDCYSQRYCGTIHCGSLAIDVKFTFERNSYTGECDFVLESQCLGLIGDARLRRRLDPYSDCRNPAFDFEVDVSACGSSYCTVATISTKKADYIENPLSKGCAGCTDCRCMCRCVCIRYESEYCPPQTQISCFDAYRNAWSASFECRGRTVDLLFELVTDRDLFPYVDTVLCRVVLTSTALGLNRALADNPFLSCPNASHFWSTTTDDGVSHLIRFDCSECGLCPTITPCCPNPLPTTLTATITTDCGEYSTELTYDPSGDVECWESDVIEVECLTPYGHPPIHDICQCRRPKITLCCHPPVSCAWILSVGCHSCGATTALDPLGDSVGSCQCDPFVLKFGPFPQNAFCDCPDKDKVGFTVVITE